MAPSSRELSANALDKEYRAVLSELRIANGRSQIEVARASSSRYSFLCNIEIRSQTPRIAALFDLREGLDIEHDAFMRSVSVRTEAWASNFAKEFD